MDFTFGRNIHGVHPNKSPLKILEKRDRAERIQGLDCPAQYVWVGLSQEQVKL